MAPNYYVYWLDFILSVLNVNSVFLNCSLLHLSEPFIYYWRRKWQPTPVFLPGKSHGLRILVGYSPWGRKELDMTERLHFTSLHKLFDHVEEPGS